MPSTRQPQDSEVRAELREWLRIFWLPLGIGLGCVPLYFNLTLLLGVMFIGLDLQGGRRTVAELLIRFVALVTLPLMPLPLMSTWLWAEAVFSAPVTGRRLRPWTVAIGSTTGVLLVLDALALWILGHLGDFF
jgi:hypothetical protein